MNRCRVGLLEFASLEPSHCRLNSPARLKEYWALIINLIYQSADEKALWEIEDEWKLSMDGNHYLVILHRDQQGSWLQKDQCVR